MMLVPPERTNVLPAAAAGRWLGGGWRCSVWQLFFFLTDTAIYLYSARLVFAPFASESKFIGRKQQWPKKTTTKD